MKISIDISISDQDRMECDKTCKFLNNDIKTDHSFCLLFNSFLGVGKSELRRLDRCFEVAGNREDTWKV